MCVKPPPRNLNPGLCSPYLTSTYSCELIKKIMYNQTMKIYWFIIVPIHSLFTEVVYRHSMLNYLGENYDHVIIYLFLLLIINNAIRYELYKSIAPK